MTDPLLPITTVSSYLPYLHCRWCRSALEATRVLCPACGSDELAEEASAGRGTVHRVLDLSFSQGRVTQVRQTCAVALDEGFVTLATVRGPGVGAIAPGARVRLLAAGRDRRLPEFQPFTG